MCYTCHWDTKCGEMYLIPVNILLIVIDCYAGEEALVINFVAIFLLCPHCWIMNTLHIHGDEVGFITNSYVNPLINFKKLSTYTIHWFPLLAWNLSQTIVTDIKNYSFKFVIFLFSFVLKVQGFLSLSFFLTWTLSFKRSHTTSFLVMS